jgi:hypothetical protein
MGKGGRARNPAPLSPQAAQFAAYLQGRRSAFEELDAMREALQALIDEVDHSFVLDPTQRAMVITALRRVQRGWGRSPQR